MFTKMCRKIKDCLLTGRCILSAVCHVRTDDHRRLSRAFTRPKSLARLSSLLLLPLLPEVAHKPTVSAQRRAPVLLHFLPPRVRYVSSERLPPSSASSTLVYAFRHPPSHQHQCTTSVVLRHTILDTLNTSFLKQLVPTKKGYLHCISRDFLNTK